MSLIDELLNAQGGGVASRLSGRFGLQEDQVRSAVQALVPAIAGGMQRNARQEGGMESLLGALGQGGHDRYLDEPASRCKTTGSTMATPSSVTFSDPRKSAARSPRTPRRPAVWAPMS